MSRVEERSHLGPHEVEIDTPMYGVMLLGSDGRPIMSNIVYDTIAKAEAQAIDYGGLAYIVRIRGTHE